MIDIIDAWLRLAATRVNDQAAALTALDQAIGDGDHGTNMKRGFTAIVASLEAGPPEGDGPLLIAGARLRGAGRTLISTVGGAAGPLYGTALMRAGGAVTAAEAAKAGATYIVLGRMVTEGCTSNRSDWITSAGRGLPRSPCNATVTTSPRRTASTASAG